MRRLSVLLLVCGLALLLVPGWRGFSAYSAITTMDAAARVDTPNPLLLLDALTSTGVTVNNQIDARSRAAYSAALQEFVLDGTGVLLGIVLLGGGVFVRYG